MHRLGIGFGTILILMISLGSVALHQMGQLSDLTRKMYRHPFQVSNTVQRVDSNIIRLHNAMKDVALSRIPQELQIAVLTMQALEEEIERDFKAIKRLYLGEHAMVDHALALYKEWLPIRDEIIMLVKDGEPWRAAEIAKGRGAAHMELITQSMALLNESTQYEAQIFFNHTRKVRRQAFILMYWALGLAFTAGLYFTWLVTRSVASPVQEIVEVSDAIAKGDLHRQITYHSEDEVGQMAASLRHMLSGVIGEGQSIKRGIPIVLWTADTELKMTYINRAAATLAEELTEVEAEGLVGDYRVDEVMKDEDGLCGIMARKSLLYGMQNDMELYFRCADDVRCLRCVTSQLKDLTGQVVGVMGVGIDITQRIKAEERLMESEARLEEAQRIAHLGHWEVNLETGLATWSQEFYRIFGLEPAGEPISREGLKKIVSPEHFEIIDRILGAILNEGRTVFEERITLPDGTTRWVVGKGLLARSEEGTPLSAFGTVQDVTEQKQAEESRRTLEGELRQSQKLQAIGTLAGGIAHDFNNILAAILGFSELLEDEVQKESLEHQYVEEILKAARRARDLVKQILNFSRQADQTLTPVFLRPVIGDAVKLLRATIPSTITIDISLGEGPEKPVMADPTQIHQMVMNLGANAAHAMKHQGRRIAVTLTQGPLPAEVMGRHTDLKPGEYQCFTIDDQGCGLAPETRQRIFDPFFTTKEPGEGTGMGLSVVHGIVKALKGTIEVESVVGQGTRFAIYLPTVDAAPPDADAPDEAALPTGGEHILLVDDEEAILSATVSSLQSLGYRVTKSQAGDEALGLFQNAPDDYHLVITDMNMPNLNGAQLSEKLLAIRPDIPIILLTGYSDQIDEPLAKKIGIRSYLLKPLARNQLAHAVRDAMGPGSQPVAVTMEVPENKVP
ncbi:response regulator [Desulfoluna butyratoxydans]|nr:response regulator [Desulfoluna butyratoxydans]